MNSLDLLIHRIRITKTVSNEDAVDTVKQYWDDAVDTVKGYWNDVDDEIVEETGITKPSLTTLLDDHRTLNSYANYGGKSGIVSYDIGDDWILVNFTTGSKYLYTIKSTTPDNINQMKQLAHAGKGLNSFIMRVLKTDYAGRNVKGELVIRPGMEQWTAERNKRLQLLYAYKSTLTVSTEGYTMSHKTLRKYKEQIAAAGMDGLDSTAQQFMTVGLESISDSITVSTEADDGLTPTQRLEAVIDRQTISNEGVFDSLKKLLGMAPKQSNSSEPIPTPELEKDVVEQAEEFYVSDVTEIPVVTVSKGYSATFMKNGSYNPNWVADLKRDVTEYEKAYRGLVSYDKVMARWQNKFEPKLENFLGDNDRQPEFLTVLKEYVKEQPKPYTEVFKSTHDYVIYGRTFVNGEGDFIRDTPGPDGATAVDIPAMDAKQTKAVKDLIMSLVKLYWTMFDNSFDLGYYGADFTDPPFRGYGHDAAVIEELNKLTVHAHALNNPSDLADTLDSRLTSVISSLAKYVSKA